MKNNSEGHHYISVKKKKQEDMANRLTAEREKEERVATGGKEANAVGVQHLSRNSN